MLRPETSRTDLLVGIDSKGVFNLFDDFTSSVQGGNDSALPRFVAGGIAQVIVQFLVYARIAAPPWDAIFLSNGVIALVGILHLGIAESLRKKDFIVAISVIGFIPQSLH